MTPFLLPLALVLATTATTADAAPRFWTVLPRPAHRPAAPMADLAEHARPAVVHVRGTAPPEEGSTDGQGEHVSIGTGFIINRDGYIVTNDHVVRNVRNLRVRLHDGRELRACVLGTDAPTDIALLKIDTPEKLPFLPLGDSDALRVGEPVVAIGNPFGFNNSVTAGIVSAKERVVERSALGSGEHAPGADSYSFFIQTDASINLGNSGGPLLDQAGQVVGVSAAFWAGHPMQPAQGIGFAIPINMAKALLPRLRDTGSAPRAYLGVDAQPLEASLVAALNLPSTRGALLASVEKDSPADAAGLGPGDVLVSWDGIPIATSEDLKIHAQLSVPGTRVHVGVLRDGAHLDREVTMRASPVHAPAAVHPSSCSLVGEGPPPRLEEIAVADLPADSRGRPQGGGVAISTVDDDSAVAEAGLRTGDIILRIGRTPVRKARDVAVAIKAQTGEVIPVLVRRSGYDFWAALRRR